METVRLTASDGVTLEGDLRHPQASPPVGGVLVCHPHPQYGGNRHHPIVDAVFTRLPEMGMVSVRFDFRSDFGGGTGEQLDVVAGLDELARHTDGPLAVVGYSFGAAVALSTTDARIAAIAAVAPPLAMSISSESAVTPSAPVLVITPRHDQFSSPEQNAAATSSWPGCDHVVVESADHFLVGQSAHIADTVATWLAPRLGSV